MTCNHEGCSHDHGHDHAHEHAAPVAAVAPDHAACGEGCTHDHGAQPTIEEAVEPNYRAAAAGYETAFLALIAHLDAAQTSGEKADPAVQLPLVEALNTSEDAAEAALVKVFDLHAHGAIIKRYVSSGRAFAHWFSQVVTAKKNPLGGEHRGQTKRLFDNWKHAEREYASAGFRTISTDGWFSSIPQPNTLHRSVHGFLMVPRDAGEQQILHAQQLASKYASLKLPVPGQNMKKMIRKAAKAQRGRR